MSDEIRDLTTITLSARRLEDAGLEPSDGLERRCASAEDEYDASAPPLWESVVNRSGSAA